MMVIVTITIMILSVMTSVTKLDNDNEDNDDDVNNTKSNLIHMQSLLDALHHQQLNMHHNVQKHLEA